MKSLIFIFILIELSVFSSSGQNHKVPQITYNDSAYIKIIASNIVDTLSVQASLFSSFRFFGGDWKKTDIVNPGIYYMALGMTMPDLVYFNIGEDFQAFLIPGDTLVINVGFKVNDKNEFALYYKINGNINDYYQAKKKKFGYYSFINSNYNGIDRFYKDEISRSEYNEAIDILKYSVEQNYLFLDKNKKSLPKWFFDLEKADITYGAASLSFRIYNRLKSLDRKSNTIFGVEFNNSKAILSSIYYSFLREYFYNKFPFEENLKMDINNLRINLFKFQSNLADSLLSGEIKDYFITCELADLYSNIKKAEGVKKIDSLIVKNYPQLSKDKIEFVNAMKKKAMKFIKSELAEGDNAPGFYLRDLNGTQFQLFNFSNKIVYLHFWNSLNEPVINEFKAINELYFKIGDKPIEIINICLDDNPDKWKQIIEEENLKGTNLICKGKWDKALKSAYFIEEMPHYVLIDKNGIIIKNKCNGPVDIYSELLKLTGNE